jgi:DNA repair exonuclease SbcCD nuclease subunit
MKVLYIGDPHITVAELADGAALVDLVVKTAVQLKPDAIVFLGDQYHHHSIVHLEVMNFWLKALEHLVETTTAEIYIMVGNHDKPGSGRQDIHALLAHKDRHPRVHIVERPHRLIVPTIPMYTGVLLIPHQDSGEEFLKLCSHFVSETKTVVCHQTFDGGRYENGFYAKDGVDPEKVPQPSILSGHIHAPQEFGKVWYVGAPRWRTTSDANTERAIWLVEHDDTGAMVSRTAIDTGDVCRRILDLEETEVGGLVVERYDTKKDDVRLTLKGPDFWLKAYGKMRKEQGFKVRTVCTDTKSAPRVRESEGIAPAFKKFVSAYKPKNNTPLPVLEKLVAERFASV